VCVDYVQAEESSQSVVEKDSAPAAKKTKASKPAKDDAAQVSVVDCFVAILVFLTCDKYRLVRPLTGMSQ